MNRWLVATRNPGKQCEFKRLLAPWPIAIVFPDDIGLTETPVESDLEVFDTFPANARAKADWFAARSGLPSLADDSGLEVDALRGAPGVHSKRFAGLNGADRDVTGANNELLLERMRDVADADRTARYRCVVVLARPSAPGRATAPSIEARGACEGRILRAPRGAGGFGYDPLFWSIGLRLTFGEASDAAKDLVSHRAIACQALMRTLGRSPESVQRHS